MTCYQCLESLCTFSTCYKGCSAGLSVICPRHTQLPWLRRKATSLHMFLKSFGLQPEKFYVFWVGFHSAMMWKEAWVTFNVSIVPLYKSSRSGFYFTGLFIRNTKQVEKWHRGLYHTRGILPSNTPVRKMWQVTHFAVAFHAWREGDGDAGGLAEQESFRSGAGQGVLLGRDLLGIALLREMGSAQQLITSQTTATGVSHSEVVEDVRWFGSHSFTGDQLLLWSYTWSPGHMRCLNLAVWCQGKVCVLGSCSPLPVLGRGCGFHSSWVLAWVLHARGAGGQAWRSLIDLNT